MIYCSCISCKSELSTQQLSKHFKSKLCLQGGKQPKAPFYDGHLSCVFCGKECSTKFSIIQHERTCPSNPERKYVNGMIGKVSIFKGTTKYSNEIVAKRSRTLEQGFKAGRIKLSGIASVEWYTNGGKAKLVASGKLNGGYKPNAGRSKKYKVFDTQGNPVTLQSSYEYACFEVLCELGLRWVRPKALKYDGKNYFADFYLVDFDIWLDPKNDYKAKCDNTKILKVIEQNNVKLFVLSKEQLTLSYIGRLAEMD